MDQTMTQADEIKRLKRQLEKTRVERDGALKKLGRAAEAAKKDDAKLNDNARQIMYLERQRRALVALSNGYGLLGTDHDTMWSHVSELDRIINTPKLLKRITGCTPGQFAFKLKWFEPLATECGPLFRGDGLRASDPGNRCKLYPRHILLLALIRYYTGMTEGAGLTSPAWTSVPAWTSPAWTSPAWTSPAWTSPAWTSPAWTSPAWTSPAWTSPAWTMDQSGVSKYLNLAADILERIVVSPKFLTGLLSMAESVDDIIDLVPHLRLLVDGTHILRYRPGDGVQRKASYSGKKKQFTYNVQVITNCAGLILNVSEAVDGSTHDYALFKKHLAEAGAWLLELAETCSTEGKRMKMTSDLGYQGIKKDYPQFDHEQGAKRLRKDSPDYESEHGGLSESQTKRNREVSRIRMPVEWAMGDMKRYRILRGPYAGTAQDLGRDMNVIAGLSNINELWDHENDMPGPLLARLIPKIEAGLASRIPSP